MPDAHSGTSRNLPYMVTRRGHDYAAFAFARDADTFVRRAGEDGPFKAEEFEITDRRGHVVVGVNGHGHAIMAALARADH